MDLAQFLQWNCRSIRPRKSDLIYLLNKFSPVVAAISETWLLPGSAFRVGGYACLRDDRDDGYAGCALLINKSFTFSQINLPSHNREISVIAAKVLNINFLSVYIPHPNQNLIPELSSIFSAVPHPKIILGDFNTHHISWGSHYSDSFSPFLLDLFDNCNTIVINTGSPTHRVYPSQNPKSAMDLTVCSHNLSSILSWKTLPYTLGSDHYPILIALPHSVVPTPAHEPLLKYKLHDVDWNHYAEVMDNKITNIANVPITDIQSTYCMFIQLLLESADVAFPRKKKPSKHLSSPPWWDAECSNAVKSRKEAEKCYNHCMTPENFIKYKREAAKCKKTLKKKKRNGWKHFCESLNPKTPSSLVWRSVKRYRGSFIPDSPTSNDPNIWLNCFADSLAPSLVPNKELFHRPSVSSCNIGFSNKFNQPFSSEELFCALGGLKDSSPGEDGIPFSFLVNLSPYSKSFFLQLLNAIFISGIIPTPWRRQIIIPILKQGKDPLSPSSYRPIALSSVLCKILEHLIKNRLEWLVESNEALPRSQFGFRKGKGTLDSLSILTTDIRIAFSNEEHLLGVFLDISSAYDNVYLPLLRNKMLQLSIPERIINFICNLFIDRQIIVRHHGFQTSPRQIWSGLPQGSVLSPLLFNIYTFNLENCTNSFANLLQYADDLVLYKSSSSIHETSAALNSALHYLNSWLEDHHLNLSPSKSRAVVFTRKRNLQTPSLFCNTEIIPVHDTVKFLGVHLDPKLSGAAHFNYVAQKSENCVNILRSLSGVWWGSHPYCQKLLYNAIVRSHLDYGSFIFEPCNKIPISKLDLIQAKCLRIVIGAMRSSPKNALQVECADPPLPLRRQYISDKFLFKISQDLNHPLFPKLETLRQKIVTTRYWSNKNPTRLADSYNKFRSLQYPNFQTSINPLYKCSYEALVYSPTVILDIGITKGDPNANSLFNEYVSKTCPDWLLMFSDASQQSQGEPVGSAVWIPKFKVVLTFKCPPTTTIFTGEGIAIYEAISYAETHNIKKAAIFSDSKSCLQAIIGNQFRNKSRHPIILLIKELLWKSQTRGLEIILCWVPGHSGITGNDEADKWAKISSISGTMLHYKSYANDLSYYANTLLKDSWNSDWQTTRLHTGQYYGSIQPKILSKPWFFKYRKGTKRATSVICRLRLGHVCTPVFLNKIHIRDHSICECGLDEGSPDHIFFNCHRYSTSLYDVLPSFIPRPINMHSLLSFIDTPLVQVLSQYIDHFNINL